MSNHIPPNIPLPIVHKWMKCDMKLSQGLSSASSQTGIELEIQYQDGSPIPSLPYPLSIHQGYTHWLNMFYNQVGQPSVGDVVRVVGQRFTGSQIIFATPGAWDTMGVVFEDYHSIDCYIYKGVGEMVPQPLDAQGNYIGNWAQEISYRKQPFQSSQFTSCSECWDYNPTNNPNPHSEKLEGRTLVPIPKIIKSFNLDFSDLPATSERRGFSILGSGEAEFKLEIKDNTTGYYYNFITNVFQSSTSALTGKISNGSYAGVVVFPAVTGGDDQYDIYLHALAGTSHVPYIEARFGDRSLDINSSVGSNSLLMQKVIYQYAALTLTLQGYSIGGTVAAISGGFGTDTISINRGKTQAKTAFSFTTTAATTAAYRILKQPVARDVIAFVSPVAGSTPVGLPGENIYPLVNGTGTVGGTAGDAVTMEVAVASKMKVGDRVTGNTALDATTATVVSLDSEFVFTLSEAIAIADAITLSFSNQMNYSWPVDNYVDKIKEGMILVSNTNITADTVVGKYQDTITIFEGTGNEEVIIKNERPALDTLSKEPTVVNGLVTVQAGNIVFDKQQVLALGGDTLKIGGYGEDEILRVYGWEVKFTDLAITLTVPTTTTREATSAHAVIDVNSREGVIDNVSRVGGIGINSALQNPLITAGGGATGTGDWTMDGVQTLENGTTLTIENTGRIATITGNIEIVKAGVESQTLRFDIEKLLSTSA